MCHNFKSISDITVFSLLVCTTLYAWYSSCNDECSWSNKPDLSWTDACYGSATYCKCFLNKKNGRKNALYLSVNVFRMKVLIGNTIFTSPTGDGTAILCGHLSHVKV